MNRVLKYEKTANPIDKCIITNKKINFQKNEDHKSKYI